MLTLLNFFLQKNVSPWHFLYLSLLQTELVKEYSLVDKLQDFSLAVNVKVSYVAIQNAKKLKSPYPNLTIKAQWYCGKTTVDSLLTDTSVKRTLRVGPCLSLLPLFDSL